MTDLTNTLEISYEDSLPKVPATGIDFTFVEEEIKWSTLLRDPNLVSAA